jgi:hypothetical protein
MTFTGPVVSVLDGDTIEVLHNNHAERIRLNGIDCPEKGQAFGERAKQAASALVFGKEVTLQTHGHGKYTRTLPDVLLSDGANVNHTLVKDGWCWWYRKYAPGNKELEMLEKKRERRGKVCGLIRSRCRRGSGGRGNNHRVARLDSTLGPCAVVRNPPTIPLPARPPCPSRFVPYRR